MNSQKSWKIISGLIVGLSACSSRDSSDASGEGSSWIGEESGSGGNGSGGNGNSSDDDDGLRLDVGSGTGGDGDADGGDSCKKVDVLIAIDNSGSMSEEIEALKGPVFDSFPETLLKVGNGLESFNLAVIDACNAPAAFHNWGKQGNCNFSSGKNYMQSTSATLLEEYKCVMGLSPQGYNGSADLCTGKNDDEQPGNTAAQALSSPAIDDYNQDFLREDAVLFVVAITDEDEQPSPGRSAAEIAQALIDAKGSIDRVVFLGIGGAKACEGPYGDAEEAPVLAELAGIFAEQEHGLFWDLCEGSLEEAFQAGLQIVDNACDDFVNPL